MYCTRQPTTDGENVGQELDQKVANTEHTMDHHTVEVGDDLGCTPAGSRRMDELGKKQRIAVRLVHFGTLPSVQFPRQVDI